MPNSTTTRALSVLVHRPISSHLQHLCLELSVSFLEALHLWPAPGLHLFGHVDGPRKHISRNSVDLSLWWHDHFKVLESIDVLRVQPHIRDWTLQQMGQSGHWSTQLGCACTSSKRHSHLQYCTVIEIALWQRAEQPQHWQLVSRFGPEGMWGHGHTRTEFHRNTTGSVWSLLDYWQ